MISPEEVMQRYPENVDKFFRILFSLTEEQLAAVDEEIPMTYEIFESCCDLYSKIGAEDELFELLIKYPEFAEKSAKKIEMELGISEDDIVPLTAEESQAGLNDLKRRMGISES